jgi:non-canonical poly(A) RNA polymerase PAPD5/7
MRPLIYVLKYFLRQRKLNESYTGGISSFLLFNLLFAYIQYTTKENDSSIKTLGHLLTGFLQFYSFVFNYEEVGISIRHGGFFYKKSERLDNNKLK